MRYKSLGLLMVAAACVPSSTVRTGSAAGEVAPTVVVTTMPTSVGDAYSGTALSLDQRMSLIESYVESLEARLPGSNGTGGFAPLTMTTTTLSPDAFRDVSEEEWARMDAYYDGVELKRIRMIPPDGGDTGTEEFYFDHGRLVYAYYEPDGATKSDPHAESGGEAFYFGTEGLISWVKNGSRVDPSNPDFKYWGEQLLKEAARFSKDTK